MKTNKNTKIGIGIGIASAALAVAVMAYGATRPAPVVSKRETPFAQRKRQMDTIDKAVKAGLAALDRGDDAAARTQFRAAEAAASWANLWMDRSLAEEYDKLGREREALATYRDLMCSNPRASSSDRDDPQVLARYGDLAARYGSPKEAEAAYRRAVERGRDRLSDESPSIGDDAALLAVPAAAAHVAAGIKASGTGGTREGRETARKEFERAVALAPSSPVARFGLSNANHAQGRWDLSRTQMAQAESLAGGDLRRAIHRVRESRGYIPMVQDHAAIRRRLEAAARAAREWALAHPPRR